MQKSPIFILLLSLVFAWVSGCSKQTVPDTSETIASSKSNPDATEGSLYQGEWRLKNLRKLTAGGENAEAYFSADGHELIFQSTRDGFQCDQIFRMNVDGTDKRLVSTGIGRTTCSFILPDNSGIVYSSSHATMKTCPPKPDHSMGYVWPLLADFEIYKAGPNGEDPQALAPHPGYDAEAVVSPIGDRIVFTSTRGGDVDIWSMAMDGSDLKQLTHEEGYDGGAFFSRDGTKIVYRAHHPTGQALEEYRSLRDQNLVRPGIMNLWVMDSDGSNKQEILANGAANFAPYFHPDGRIIFSSNMDDPGGRNFDLYLINQDGTGLERVTYSPFFDSFPMFSYDGKYLVFSSNRDGKEDGETNVFVAEWSDEAPPRVEASGLPSADRMMADIRVMSGEGMEGRGLGTKGLEKAAAWLEEEFKNVGLEDLNGSYVDPLEVSVRSKVVRSKLAVDGKTVDPKKFTPLAFSSAGKVDAESVFVGFGISSSEYDYDDYTQAGKALDVSGKVAVMYRYEPQRHKGDSRFEGKQPIRESELRYKAIQARHHGAAAVVIVNPVPREGEKDVLVKGGGVASELGIPVIHMTWDGALAIWGPKFNELEMLIDGHGEPRSGRELGKFQIDVEISRERETVKNVVGILKANKKAHDDVLVIGAHYDHLGHGGDSSMRPGADAIHPGADDNASGVAMMLELARLLKGVERTRDIVFVGFTGEESGLLGSSHFAAAGPLKDRKIAAMLNLDMVGRLRGDRLHVMGVGTGMTLRDTVRRSASGLGLNLVLDPSGFGPSDHMSFYLQKIPVLSLFTGVHENYHTPDDTAETLNQEGLLSVATFALRAATELANLEAPAYVAMTGSTQGDRGGDGSRGYGPSFGSIPSFGEPNQPGVKVSGARPGSSADKAGLLADDIIVKFGEFDITNLQDFAFALRQHEAGQEIDVVVVRAGEQVTLRAVLGEASK